MSMIKYRIHEVAKDFNVTSKVISQILTDYIAAPKNHMQVLENKELDVIFEYMTQHNQVDSLQDIFNAAEKAEPQKKAQQAEKPAEPQKKPQQAGKMQPQGQKNAQPQAAKPQSAAPAQPAAQAHKQDKPHTPRQVAEKRVVDTRGGAAVNIEKYNEKFEDMAGG